MLCLALCSLTFVPRTQPEHTETLFTEIIQAWVTWRVFTVKSYTVTVLYTVEVWNTKMSFNSDDIQHLQFFRACSPQHTIINTSTYLLPFTWNWQLITATSSSSAVPLCSSLHRALPCTASSSSHLVPLCRAVNRPPSNALVHKNKQLFYHRLHTSQH